MHMFAKASSADSRRDIVNRGGEDHPTDERLHGPTPASKSDKNRGGRDGDNASAITRNNGAVRVSAGSIEHKTSVPVVMLPVPRDPNAAAADAATTRSNAAASNAPALDSVPESLEQEVSDAATEADEAAAKERARREMGVKGWAKVKMALRRLAMTRALIRVLRPVSKYPSATGNRKHDLSRREYYTKGVLIPTKAGGATGGGGGGTMRDDKGRYGLPPACLEILAVPGHERSSADLTRLGEGLRNCAADFLELPLASLSQLGRYARYEEKPRGSVLFDTGANNEMLGSKAASIAGGAVLHGFRQQRRGSAPEGGENENGEEAEQQQQERGAAATHHDRRNSQHSGDGSGSTSRPRKNKRPAGLHVDAALVNATSVAADDLPGMPDVPLPEGSSASRWRRMSVMKQERAKKGHPHIPVLHVVLDGGVSIEMKAYGVEFCVSELKAGEMFDDTGLTLMSMQQRGHAVRASCSLNSKFLVIEQAAYRRIMQATQQSRFERISTTLRRHHLFADIGTKDMTTLQHSATLKRFHRGAVIAKEATFVQAIGFIVAGEVRMLKKVRQLQQEKRQEQQQQEPAVPSSSSPVSATAPFSPALSSSSSASSSSLDSSPMLPPAAAAGAAGAKQRSSSSNKNQKRPGSSSSSPLQHRRIVLAQVGLRKGGDTFGEHALIPHMAKWLYAGGESGGDTAALEEEARRRAADPHYAERSDKVRKEALSVKQRYTCSLVAETGVDIIHLPPALLVHLGTKEKLDTFLQQHRENSHLLDNGELCKALDLERSWDRQQKRILKKQFEVSQRYPRRPKPADIRI
eukprot:g3832.t1